MPHIQGFVIIWNNNEQSGTWTRNMLQHNLWPTNIPYEHRCIHKL